MRVIRFLVMTMAVFFLLVSFVLGQENTQKKNVTSSDVKQDMKEAAKTTGTYLEQKKERYEKKAEDKLHRMENKVKGLYARAEKKSAEAKEKLSRAADELKAKSDSAKNKLKDLKDAGEEKWDKARAELDSKLKDLERSYNRTAAKFKD